MLKGGLLPVVTPEMKKKVVGGGNVPETPSISFKNWRTDPSTSPWISHCTTETFHAVPLDIFPTRWMNEWKNEGCRKRTGEIRGQELTSPQEARDGIMRRDRDQRRRRVREPCTAYKKLRSERT